MSIRRCAVSWSTSPSAITALAWLNILSTFRLPSSTISSNARLNRKSPTNTLAGLPPDEVGGGLAATHSRSVDDIVVEQGRGVDELDRGGQFVVPRPRYNRSSAALASVSIGRIRFAAARDQMPGKLGDQPDGRLHPLEDHRIDRVHVARGSSWRDAVNGVRRLGNAGLAQMWGRCSVAVIRAPLAPADPRLPLSKPTR